MGLDDLFLMGDRTEPWISLFWLEQFCLTIRYGSQHSHNRALTISNHITMDTTDL